ncbi:hypothetical protein BJY04DRAFT_191791, partial [Aspergillus karnatakaensis]|uniref:uncharacterized protein n=1 Tax=Aspergillus karnatakaensis TaxID=1810916 RepID=UPI003CCE4EBB
MDAYAYLIRHGWSGTGNPLNPDRAGGTRGGLGLTKPLLVARRSGNSGVGNKTTKDPTNQWWLRGFEDALKGVGQERDESLGVVGKGNALTSELYRHFVRGEVVPGTLGGKKKNEETGKDGEDVKVKVSTSKKRKRDDDVDAEVKEKEKEERKEEKKAKKMKKKAEKEGKREKKDKKEKKEKKERKARPEEDYPTPASTDLDSTADSPLSTEKAEKKEKKEKRDKKDKKERKDKDSRKDRSSKESKKSKQRDSSSD